MALPDLIEIVPLDKPVRAEIAVPGSKSITNRALILAALARGETNLLGALWSEDTQVMVDCLQKLGFEISVARDPKEVCNRTITVRGLGGKIPDGGTAEKPLELFVGNAGTAARFLAAFVCLGSGVYRLHGVPRMNERPKAALFSALRQLGYRVESENGNEKLPVKIFADGEHGTRNAETKTCTVNIAESSQFASALLLGAKIGNWEIQVVGENAEESPYVAMTAQLIKVFPHSGGSFQIEPDASSASYFVAANWLIRFQRREEIESWKDEGLKAHVLSDLYNRPTFVKVAAFPKSNWQMDAAFPDFLPLPRTISRQTNLGDSIMTAIVMAPFASSPTTFTDLERLRMQECERVVALRTELAKCGAEISEQGDTLTVLPSGKKLHGAEIETYHDHRMAMCFAILGLKVAGIKIKNPACVKKTFPNFFQKMAWPPTGGLGAKIVDGKTGRLLPHDELFAD